MISAIVAVDQNWGIGYKGELLEYLPPDLEYFKELTTNHIVVMGRKTWDSLPKKPLKDRLNIVISSQPKEVLGDLSIRISMEEAKIRLALSSADEKWFIIGGGTIYKELLPICDRVYVTKILKDHENVDTYFPDLDKSSEWEIDTCTDLRTSDNINYAFLTYDRIS
jgi:dihydrofolate reductase